MLTKTELILEQKKLDALLVSDGYNVRYLSGYCGEGYLYISKRRNVILTDSRYTIQAKAEAPECDVCEISKAKDYQDWLKEIVREDGVKVLGFEDLQMIYHQVVELKKALGGLIWVELGEELNQLRQIKTPEEIALLQKAESIGDQAFEKIIKELRPGMTELQVAAKLDYYMKEAGATKNSFETIAASGLHSAMPHAIPSNKPLQSGDLLTMDFGCCYQGYCSDMTRTVVIGKANQKQKEIYQLVLQAQMAALSQIKAGMTGAAVDQVARDIIAQAGYGAYFGHGLGHGVGLYIHEEPRLSPSCNKILKEHMIQTVEPGIYLPGFGGVRIEDMVAVTKEGCINLSNSPKELMEL